MVVAKKKADEDFCSNCAQSRNCGAVYRQLSKAKGPSVAAKVIVAFLLPIAVFIIALAGFEKVFASAPSGENLRIALSATSAAAVSFLCILVIKAIKSRPAENKSSCVLQGEAESRQKAD